MAAGAQCGGKEKVIEMFSNRKIQAWAVWLGKQFLCTGYGVDELSSYLDMIENGTNACYTLKVYKGITDGDDIDEKTAAAGSFNFYPKERDVNASAGSITGNSVGRSIGAVQRVIEEKIAQKIGEMLDADSKPERERKSKLGLLGEILDHEVLGSIFEKIALQWLSPAGIITNAATAAVTPALQMRAVGNIASDTELIKALELLKLHDPKLTEHLTKLAKLAQADQNTFNILIGSIDKMRFE